MAQSALEARAAALATTPRERQAIASYTVDLRHHEFTKDEIVDGKATGKKVKTGEAKWAARILPVYADGKQGLKALAWIWLDEPSSLRAFVTSAGQMVQSLVGIDADMVTDKVWPAAPVAAAPKAEAKPAAAAKPLTALEKRAAAMAAEASKLDGALDDLPF